MTARLFTCSVPDCDKPHVRDRDGCDQCEQYLCVTHRNPDFHTCNDRNELPDDEYAAQIVAELDRLRAKLDDKAACSLASRLNGGRSCTIEHSNSFDGSSGGMMGCANYHARIRFDDGSRSWLLRVPRVTSYAVAFPPQLVAYLVRSEYATLKFLETTNVPAPKVFAYGVKGDGDEDDGHGLGVSFLLMEELPGKPWYGNGPDGKPATPEEWAKIWRQYAEILVELALHPFPKAGSLLEDPTSGIIQVSAQASNRFLVLSPEGPFDTAAEYFSAAMEQYLDLIVDGQVYTEYPVDAYLLHRFLKDKAHDLVKESTTPEQFFLKHVDDKGDHILVDEHLNITGVIDWQMARVVPPAEAFGSSLVTADMRGLYEGESCLTENDKILSAALAEINPDLAQYNVDERVRRVVWGLAHETKWSYALPLVNALLKIFGIDKTWEEWRVAALEEYANNERLQKLLKEAESAEK